MRHWGGEITALDVTGQWDLKLRIQGAADYRSLQPEDLRNVYLVVRFKLS
ncbi:hypothetical protein [Acrocarpospora sp. B8E8]